MTLALQRLAWWTLLALLCGIVVWKGVLIYARVPATFTGVRNQAPAEVEPLPGRAVPIMRSQHIPYIGAEHQPYSTYPVTSGPHVPWTVLPGVYPEPLPPELQLHAMEHGHVILQYRPQDVQPEEVVRFSRRYPRDVVVAPDAKLPAAVSLTSWGRVLLLASVDQERVDEFIRKLRGRYDHGWVGHRDDGL